MSACKERFLDSLAVAVPVPPPLLILRSLLEPLQLLPLLPLFLVLLLALLRELIINDLEEEDEKPKFFAIKESLSEWQSLGELELCLRLLVWKLTG
jgi:hypothetical protein